ncbi:hypothetical protein ACHAXR_012442 [Thalassiosira sp. AJA248-18]
MWRSATLRLRQSNDSHALRMLSSQLKLPSLQLQRRCQSSIPPSMENAETLEEVMAAVEEQSMEDERRRAIENPTPWFNLLHYPSRAAWRSTDHVLGAKGADVTPLSQTQFNLLQHSQRTNKQLRRTYKRIMETHRALALKRERERRLAANLSAPPKPMESGPDGSIKDGKGKHVGDWREKKKISAPAALCDDPSVALALSTGLSNSKFGADNELLNNGMTNVKSARNANRLAKSRDMSSAGSKEKPIAYGPEQTVTNVRYRLGPNYSIVKRVLLEVQSLLGGTPPEGSKRSSFQPKRVLDFGSGAGSSSAAALDVFGVSRSASSSNSGGASSTTTATNGIDWIHSIDASQCMREATEKVLKSILEGAPWDSEPMRMELDDAFNEELEEYERVIKQIRGEPDSGKLERQRKRMQKWEHTWNKLTNFRTRLTFGESIVDASSFYADDIIDKDDRPPLPWQQKIDEQRRRAIQKKARTTSQKGSFDLILCSYTLSELPNVPSSLTATALLWEKLAPDGVMVFVEPGTPDGFNILRSVRSMLLEVCPPPELKERRRRAVMAENGQVDDKVSDELKLSLEDEDNWPEECHVIAPCTHNGTCPMSRHQRNHVKRNTRFGKYEAAGPKEEEGEGEGEGNESEEQEENEASNPKGLMGDWERMNEDEREEMKMMVGVEDLSDEEMEAMMKHIDSMEDSDDEGEADQDSDSDSDSDDEDDNEEYYNVDKQFYNVHEETNDQEKSMSTLKQTDVFDTAFCSFVHNFPGGASRKRGEKFSYLVLQKRTPDRKEDDISSNSMASERQDALDVDVVEMLSKSVHHAQQVKEEDKQKRREQKDFYSHGYHKDNAFHKAYFEKTDDPYHKEQSYQILQKAVEAEDKYLDSTMDKLGLEMLYGDDRRKGWGRLIRAPLKRKGHILLDYCSAGCGGGNKGCSKNIVDGAPDRTQGRITRQQVSRGWSARAAPGCHSAARKARWGGLWPDLSERVKQAERKDESEREMQKNSLGG